MSTPRHYGVMADDVTEKEEEAAQIVEEPMNNETEGGYTPPFEPGTLTNQGDIVRGTGGGEATHQEEVGGNTEDPARTGKLFTLEQNQAEATAKRLNQENANRIARSEYGRRTPLNEKVRKVF
jgi:hypothetical protein